MTAPSEYGSTLMSQSHKSQSPNRKVNEEIRQARLEKEEREKASL